MTMVSTHYRGTPARPRAHEITCLSTSQGCAHIEIIDSVVVLELSGRDGSAVSIRLSVAESQRLAELLVSASTDQDRHTPALLRTHEHGVGAA